MATASYNPSPVKRIKVQSDINQEPIWLLIPAASRTVQDLVKSLLVRLSLPDSFTYDLCLEGAPILPNEDVSIVRDGEQLHLRQRQESSPLPSRSNLLQEPQHMSMSSAPDDIRGEVHRKRKRILTPEGKRRRNARNRKREKRRRLERQEPPDNGIHSISNSPHDDPKPRDDLIDSRSPRPNTGNGKAKPPVTQVRAAAMEAEHSLPATMNSDHEQDKSGDTTQPSNEDAKMASVSIENRVAEANVVPREGSGSHDRHARASHQQNLEGEMVTTPIARDAIAPQPNSDRAVPGSPSRNEPQRVSASATAPSHATNPSVSHVNLEEVLVQRTGPERNEIEPSDPLDDQDGSVRVTPAENTPPPKPPTDTELSQLNGNEQITRLQTHAEKNVPTGTANQTATIRKEDVVVPNNENNLDVISPAEGVQPEVSNSVCAREGDVSINISFVNQAANEDLSVANTAVNREARCVRHGHILSDNSQKQEQSPNETDCASVGQKDPQDPLKNVNRRNRQRPQRNDNFQVQPNPRSISVAESIEHTQRADTSVANDESDLLKTQGCSGHGTDAVMSQDERAETKTSPIDVINLVEGEEDRVKAVDTLRGSHQSLSTNSSKSNSPQSIVVSPAEPGEAILAAVNLCTEVSKKRFESVNKETDSGHQVQGTAQVTENTTPVRTSRRKPTRPRRLSKPNADVDLNNVAASWGANSGEEHDRTEELPEILPSLDHVVVNDGRQDSVKELQVAIGREGQHNAPVSAAETLRTQRTQESDGKVMEVNSSKFTSKDKRKKQSCLKGGISTLDALRVARAHGARRLTAEKQKADASLRDGTETIATENKNTTQDAKTDSNPRRSGGETRKKRKRRKRSKSSMRYLNEEQMNKSVFVGRRPETMLPPLELLDLPDDAAELRQAVDVPEDLPATPKMSPLGTASDRKRDAETTSEPHDKPEGTPSFATTATNPVFLCESRSETSKREMGQHAGEPSSHLEDPSVSRNNQSEEQAPDRQRNDIHRGIVAHNTSESLRTIAVNNVSPQLETSDSFREGLLQMLRHTSKTLAEVWAKWDDSK